MNNYEKEIAYRKELWEKERQKYTTEEREWLSTHSWYNFQLGYPYLNDSVEKLKPNTCYNINVIMESSVYENSVSAIIHEPLYNQVILPDFPVIEVRTKKVKQGKKISMLEISYDNPGKSVDFKYETTELGLMSVAYFCDYFDKVSPKVKIGKVSSDGWIDYAMKREVISDNKIRFHCKSPLKDTFDALVFTVEWTEI